MEGSKYTTRVVNARADSFKPRTIKSPYVVINILSRNSPQPSRRHRVRTIRKPVVSGHAIGLGW